MPLSRVLLSLSTVVLLLTPAISRGAEPAPAKLESIDDQARYLAGLPVAEGSPLKELEKSPEWQDYSKNLEADWARLRERRLDQMIAWSTKELQPQIDPKANLFYVFGGPDLVSVAALYPEAPVYILCGLEPVGQVPQLTSLRKPLLDRAMGNLRRTLNTTVRASFFKTMDMAGDLTRTELRGVMPLLYLFAARSDARLIDMHMLEIDDAGNPKELGAGEKVGSGIPAARLRIQRKGMEKPQEIYYVRLNVENSMLEHTPGFFAFLKHYAPANSFFKAASFILHDGKKFSKMRDFMLENTRTILQDDSGMPYEAMKPSNWSFALYGTYLRPLSPFGRHYQTDLAKAFKDGPVKELPFVTGYRHPGESNLLLAVRKPETKAAQTGGAPANPSARAQH